MPNVEIHGLSIERAIDLKGNIFKAFQNKPYVDEMVVTIFETIVCDKNDKRQPFIRLVNSCQKHTEEIIATLKQFKLDIEHLQLEAFYPKTG